MFGCKPTILLFTFYLSCWLFVPFPLILSSLWLDEFIFYFILSPCWRVLKGDLQQISGSLFLYSSFFCSSVLWTLISLVSPAKRSFWGFSTSSSQLSELRKSRKMFTLRLGSPTLLWGTESFLNALNSSDQVMLRLTLFVSYLSGITILHFLTSNARRVIVSIVYAFL